MKRLRSIVGILLIAVCSGTSCFAADTEKPKVPVMPDTITLTSGRILKNVQVVRWERERVVLKYTGGIDPIAFSIIKSVPKEDLLKIRDAELTRQKKLTEETTKLERMKQQAREDIAEADRLDQERFEKLVGERKIAVGMSAEQAERSWGRPEKKNVSGGSYGRHEQWVYRDSGAYLYLEDGKVTSWQVER